MPSIIKVRINSARNLPTSNAYVSVSLGGHADLISHDKDSMSSLSYQRKTVVKKSINPVWNEEFRFDVADDTLLQDEPLIVTVCNEHGGALGLVYVDLNPLLMRTAIAAEEDTKAKKRLIEGGDSNLNSPGSPTHSPYKMDDHSDRSQSPSSLPNSPQQVPQTKGEEKVC